MGRFTKSLRFWPSGSRKVRHHTATRRRMDRTSVVEMLESRQLLSGSPPKVVIDPPTGGGGR